MEESGSNSLFSRLRLDQARSNQNKENCSVCSGGEATLQPGLTLSSRFPDSPPAPGAEPSVPTLTLPWAAGTGTAPPAMLGTRQDSAHPQSPTCPRPCCLLLRARLRSPRHGQSCRQQGRQPSLPGTAGRGKRRRGWTQVCAPCPAGVGARFVLWYPIRRGPCAEAVARAGGFHRRCRSRWVPAAATLQVGSPWGKAGVAALWLGDGFPGGQWVLRACSAALPARGACRVGKASGCRLRPAHSLSWCSPVHPRVPAVSGLCGSAGVRRLTAHPMANGTGKG